MSRVIGVLNYGLAGNIFNIVKAIEYVGAEVKVLQKAEDFKNIDKLVLPGVGTFSDAIREIEEHQLKDILTQTIEQKETLGICLGMQILSTLGFEGETVRGLDIIDAEAKLMDYKGVLPHIGFNTISLEKEHKLFHKIKTNDEFYFMHSYEVLAKDNILAFTDYNGYKFISAIEKDNIYGVQFHPEKSREAGLQLFKNFVEL